MNFEKKRAIIVATGLITLAESFPGIHDVYKDAFGDDYADRIGNAALAAGEGVAPEVQNDEMVAAFVGAMAEALYVIEVQD